MLDWFVKKYFGFSHLLPESDSQVSIEYYLPDLFQSSLWLFFLAVFVCVALFWSVYRLNAQQLSFNKKTILILLRTFSFLLLLLFFVRLSLKINKIDKPGLVILVDQSKSMSFQDDYGSNKIIDGKEIRFPVRMNMVKSLLANNSSGLMKKLNDSYRLYPYHFSSVPVPLVPDESSETDLLEIINSKLKGLKPDGKQSLIASSARSVLSDFRGKPPAALLIFTDGVPSIGETELLSKIAEEALGQYVPIYSIGVGSDKSLRDLSLVNIDVDDVVFVNNPVRVTASIRSSGYDKKNITIQLKDKKTGLILDEKKILLKNENAFASVDLFYEPNKTGEQELVVDLEILEDELDQINNQLTRKIKIKEEDIQVLLIEGYPRWEFRALKNLLEREQAVSLKTLLQDADLDYLQADKTALNHLPVKLSDLLKYDVIIMGDVDVNAFSQHDIKNLSDYVIKGHGGLLMIAGNLFTPNAWAKTSVSRLLPFKEFKKQNEKLNVWNKENSFKLTEAGEKQFSLFKFSEKEEVNRKIWSGFLPIHWIYHSSELKPGVIPLVELNNDESHLKEPVITFHRVGKGKVLFHFTDELWRWRFRTGDYYSSQYWGQALRYLSRSRIRGTSHLAELLVDREVVNQGETVGFLLRYYDESIISPDQKKVDLQIVDSNGETEKITLTRKENHLNEFHANWVANESGQYYVSVESPVHQSEMPETSFKVENVDQELEVRALNNNDLKKASKISKGEYLNIENAAMLTEKLPKGEPVILDSPTFIPLWNRWELFLLFCITLSVEWIMRKKNKLD